MEEDSSPIISRRAARTSTRLIRRLPLVVLLACALGGCRASRSAQFALYLPAQPTSVREMAADLQAVDLQDQPILSAEDIVTYHWDAHEILLTADAADRIEHLEVPTIGRPFVACVGAERIYSGAFWPLWSSASYDGIVIEVPLMNKRTIQLRRGYPSAEHFRGPDPRSDTRILEALQGAGKVSKTKEE